MKTHSSNYKYEIKEFGRQITSKISYGNVELGEDDLNSITPSFESSILKSAMKRLEIDSNVEIPLETEINYQFGCLVGNEYEYIDFGNYIVYSSEKHEDTNSYYIIAYDKMLYAMKDYEDLGITYPITIRNYINAICTKLGLTFANANDTFANYDKEIQHELYLNADGESIGYTYRDVLDEIAQVTASTICINDDDELEIRYINNTNDTIDEEYLRDVNVSFGEKYGPINSIVLARAESDKIYLKDYESVEENGLCEIMINDNQIMNGQDRNTYLPDILEELDGLEYYLNDFTSTGITFYDICDRYNIQIGENTYSCIMFNDSIEVTQGLNETIYTDRLEESETDYKKADKEDRKINQTRIVVDKHNQEISTLISYVGDRSDKQTSLTQDVDGLIAQVQNIPTITTEGSGYGSVTLTELANTKIAMIKVHPTNVDIIRNVVSEHLKVRIGNKVGHRGLKFIQEEESKLKLPRNLFFYDSETYDEFVLDGLEERMYVIHRVGFQNGVKVMLDTPIIEEFEYQDIIIDEGTLTITYNDYPSAYIYLKAMIKNDYTETFATKLEMNSKIEQTAQEINLEVAKKVDNDEIISKINQSAEQISIEANKINLNGVVSANGNFKIDTNGVMEAIGCRLGGYITFNDGQITNTSGSLEEKNYYEQQIFPEVIGIDGPSKSDGYGNKISKGYSRIYSNGFHFQYDKYDNWETDIIPSETYYVDFFRDTLTINGNLVVTGEKNRVVETKDGYVKLNAYETTTPYFADIGSGKLNEKGECKITIDKQFAQTIEEDTYKVFVQKLGKGDIWVEKYKNYFIVKGEPNLEFDYEIKAIQKGYANTRLEKFERSDENGISKNKLGK